MQRYVNILPGDPAPWFHQRTQANPRYAFHTAAGRYIVLCFFGSAALPNCQAALKAIHARPDLFDDRRMSFFGVSVDPKDEQDRRAVSVYPGYRYFWDFDGLIGRLYGALPVEEGMPGQSVSLRQMWIVLDPTLRVQQVVPFAADGSDVGTILRYLDDLPPPSHFAGPELQAPILLLPNVFEPELCRKLIDLYESHGGETSGVMSEQDGKTTLKHDSDHKRRKDHIITDSVVIAETQERVRRRIVPEIQKIHQFVVTRMERYIVACYAAEDHGHFRSHRDNTTKGTAHRRFAVSINLNSDFDGGEIVFPEYGTRSFKPGTGQAVVFSCSLLHAVTPVQRGRRYAFLPFLYDDEASKIREANNSYLADDVGFYVAS